MYKRIKKQLHTFINNSLDDIKSTLNHLALKQSEQSDLMSRLEDELAESQKQIAQFSDSIARLQNHQVVTISQDTALVKLFNGLKMYVNLSDMAVAAHIAIDGVWEERITRAWLRVVKHDSVVFDIGANFGYFGALAAQKSASPKSKIYMFEANPALAPYIKKTSALNHTEPFVVVENKAVADVNKKMKLRVLKDFTGSSSLHTAEHIKSFSQENMTIELEEEIEVEGITIDSYCQKNGVEALDVVKIDIEGFEDQAYEGMRKMVKNSPKVTMFIEFTKKSYKDPKKFYEMLLKDFGNVYTFNFDGELSAPSDTTYESVIDPKSDWSMPVFSKIGTIEELVSQE